MPSFSHFFLEPFIFRSPAPEALSVTTKIPLACNLVLEHGKVFACNVMSGRKLSLRHSVKHYEAMSLNCCFISGCKDSCFYEIIGYFGYEKWLKRL